MGNKVLAVKCKKQANKNTARKTPQQKPKRRKKRFFLPYE